MKLLYFSIGKVFTLISRYNNKIIIINIYGKYYIPSTVQTIHIGNTSGTRMILRINDFLSVTSPAIKYCSSVWFFISTLCINII